MVVNVLIPFSQARKVASIRSTLDAYRQLQPTAGHIRTAYLLELLLAFSVVLMLALWMGFRLAKGVTGPIRALAEGTAEVARGNLDVSVQATSDDEIGFLVGSFNQMIRDLRDARSGIERSATELERRRRYMEIVLGTVGAGVVSRGRRRADQHDQPVRAALPRDPGRQRPARPEARRRRAPARADPGDRGAVGRAAPGRAREHPAPGAGAARRRHRDAVRHAHRDARRGRRRARHGGRVRRLHPAREGPAHGGLARGGAPDRARDQEPAHADPALRAAPAPPLRRAVRGQSRGREGLRRVRRRDHEPGRHAQGARRRVLRTSRACPPRSRGPTT